MYSCQSFLSSLLLLGPYCFCSLSCPFLHEMFPWYLQFYERNVWSFPSYCFALLLCIVHWSVTYLALLFSGTLHSVGYIFPFSLALCFSSFLCCVKPPQATSFFHFFFFVMVLVTVACTIYEPLSVILQALCLLDLTPWIYSSPLFITCVIIRDLI